MVSINKNFTTSGQTTGATFFNNSTEEDGQLVQHSNMQPHHFVPLNTIPWSLLHTIVSTTISIVGIVLAIREPDDDHRCYAYFVMIYLHTAFWFLTLLVDYILKKTHHNLRVSGYLEFYQKTYTLHRAPIYLVSLWNAFLLLVQTLLQHYFSDDFTKQCIKEGISKPVSYITVFLWVETFMLSVIHGQYILKVSSFNKAQHRPDVQRDHLVGTPTSGVGGGTNVGGQQQPPALLTQTADLLARQADLIRHLREHNEKLSTKLSTTTAELKSLQHQRSTEKSPV